MTTTAAPKKDPSPSPTLQPDLIATPARTRAYTRALLRTDPRVLHSAVLLSVAAAFVGLGVPNILGRMADLIAARAQGHAVGNLLHRLDTYAFGAGAFLVVQTLLSWRAARAVHLLGERLAARLRVDVLDGLLTMRPVAIERAGTGELLSRATVDATQVDKAFRFALPTFFVNVSTIVVVLLGSLWASPLLTASALVVVPIVIPAVRWSLPRYPAAVRQLMARQATMNAVVSESADGARTVETLRWQRRRTARLEQEIDRFRGTFQRTVRLRGVLLPALDMCSLLPTLTTLVLGMILLRHHQVSLGEVTTVALLMQTFSPYFISLVESIDFFQTGSASLVRLVGLMPEGGLGRAAGPDHAGGTDPASALDPDRDPATDSATAAATDRAPGRTLDISSVSYTYEGTAREVLHDVNLTLRPGERLALVGPTGAGKTTLAHLIAGIDAPTSGSVTLDGTPLTAFDQVTLRRRVLLSTQEHHVFAATLAENLRIAAPEATDAELHRALAAVGAADWVAHLPDGLDTEVGGFALALPPDHAQQLALARILLAAPDILVLDEATSMLTQEAARDAEAALSALLGGRTLVYAAHRLHTAHEADRIAVLAEGRLVEIGTHDELVTRDGHYARLWRAWHNTPRSVP